MRILLASSEVYPFSKTGGLADVIGALSEALVRLGHEVLVISPWYKTLEGQLKPLWIGDIVVPFDGGFCSVGVGELKYKGVRYAFVGHSDFQRDHIYGFSDDPYRFARFSRAVPQVAERVNFIPDVVHANDWHTGYLPAILQDGWHVPLSLVRKPSIFTVHNAQHQGHADLDAVIYWLRLPGALRNSYFNHFGKANAIQAALGFAHKITTVSPNHAKELMTPEYGYGLDGTFKHIAHKFTGILNGLDTEVWNPAIDKSLPKPYSVEDFSGKIENKQKLCSLFGLDMQLPLLGIVSRFAEQKGIDLLLKALDGLVKQGWNLVIVGSGNIEIENVIREAARIYPNKVGSHVGYQESLARLVYAGSDAFIIPSRFEPCGLTQMIAMRYGTIPIARSTGGLRDTIVHNKTGFLFEHPTVEGILWAAGVAHQAYGTNHWQTMIKAGMAQDFSWEHSAKAYVGVYKGALELK